MAAEKTSLRGLFGLGATGTVSSAIVAPEATGKFIGSRATGVFNGIAKGVATGVINSPALLAVATGAVIVLGANLYSKFQR